MRAGISQRFDRSAALRRQTRLDTAQLSNLMDVAEAARVTMGVMDDPAPVPRLMLEDQSDERTAEDAWRGERRAPLVKPTKTRLAALSGDWAASGLWQILGGRQPA